MHTLLTKDRVRALANLNRWNGWTRRPYSVLEHSLIGFKVLRDMGYSREAQRGFLLHDLHETEFSEIITPVKQDFVTHEYHVAVAGWDDMLCRSLGELTGITRGEDVAHMDLVMRDAESVSVATAPWKPHVEHADIETGVMIGRAVCEIRDSMFASPTAAVAFFWDAMEMTVK